MAERAAPSPARQAAHAQGLAAEARAAAYLEAAGFAILSRRARTPAGEIDLVARQGGLVLFCEVKLRADRDAAAFAFGPRQQRRVAAAAEAWLADHPELRDCDARLDVLLVTRDGVLEHLPGAFDAAS